MPARIAEEPRSTRARRTGVTAVVVAVGVLLVGAAIVFGEHGARAAVAEEFAERAAPLLPGGELSSESAQIGGGPAVATLLWASEWNGTIRGIDRGGLPVSIELTGLARDGAGVASAAWTVRETVSDGTLRGVPDTAYAEVVGGGDDIRVQLAARTEGPDAVIEVYGAWLDGRTVQLEDLPADVRAAIAPTRFVLPGPAAATLVEDMRFTGDRTLHMRLVAHDVALG